MFEVFVSSETQIQTNQSYFRHQFKKVNKGNPSPPEPSQAFKMCCIMCVAVYCFCFGCFPACAASMWQRRKLAEKFGFSKPDDMMDAVCSYFCGCCVLAQDAAAAKKFALMVEAPVQAQIQQPWNPSYDHGDGSYDAYGNGYNQKQY